MHLILDKINIIFPDFYIENFSLSLDRGEFFVLLGHSGSGKTTIIQAIAGLLEIHKGKIYLNHRDITTQSTYKRNIGIVFQDFALFPHLNVFDNIAFSLKIKKIKHREIVKKVQHLLQIVNLEGYENRKIYELSGGEKQRVSLARTLAPEPEIILFDEPLSALDELLRYRLRETIKDIQKQLGFTAIYVTHDQDEAFFLADRIGIMSKGKLIRVGTPEQVYLDPQSFIVSDFLGFNNRFLCDVIKIDNNYSYLKCKDVEFKIRSNELNLKDKVYLLIKPSTGIFSDRVLSENCFDVKILKIQLYGAIAVIKIQINNIELEVKMHRSFIFEEIISKNQVLKYNLPFEAFSIVEAQ